MRNSDVVKILQEQIACIKRKCNKKCLKCDLYRSEEERIKALQIAVMLFDSQKDIKQKFFNSGIEYAKAEFVRLLEKEKENVGELHKSKAVNDLVYTQVLGLQKAIEITDTVNNIDS